MHPSRSILLAFGMTLTLPALVAAAQAASAQATSTAAPQATAPSQQNTPELSVDTLQVYAQEILVDVMVTDARGNPVRGLTQSDFAVEENGKPQPIRSFHEFDAASQVAEPAAPTLPPYIYTNSQQVPTSGPVNILLIDALNGGPRVFHAMPQIVHYLQTMPQGAQIAIFWLAENGLHMLQGFTTDRAALLRAASTNRVDIGTYGNRWTSQMTTIAALNQLAAYVGGIKGRKNLLWVTPGMPIPLLRDGGYSYGNIDMGLVHRLMDTYEMLTAAQVAVYPMDPGGIVGLGRPQLIDEQVAEQTGGEAIYNTNDLTSAIAKAIDDGSHFYTLSYIPPKKKDDGHYHRIVVRIDKPGLHLVYRQGYNAERVPTLDAPALGPPLMKAAMEGNVPAATQILFDVGVWPSPLPDSSSAAKPSGAHPKKPSRSKTKGPVLVRYEVHYGLPASEIAFAVQPDGSLRGVVEFDTVAYDINRARVALRSQTDTMPLSVEQYDSFAATAFQFIQHVNLPPGEITLRVGILDKVTNKVGTLEVPLLVFPANLSCPPRCPLPRPAPAAFGPR